MKEHEKKFLEELKKKEQEKREKREHWMNELKTKVFLFKKKITNKTNQVPDIMINYRYPKLVEMERTMQEEREKKFERRKIEKQRSDARLQFSKDIRGKKH